MISKCCVYWIHTPEQTDIFTQGYVGVSLKGIDRRFREHKYRAKTGSVYPVHAAIRKYQDIIAEIVVLAPIEYCYELEAKLRPLQGIGYNQDAGGNCNRLGSKLSDETKAKQSLSAKTRGQRPSQLALDNSAKTNSKMVAWLCRFSDKTTWLMADKIFDYMIDNNTHGMRKIGKALSYNHTKLQTVYKKIKAGWNPSEDTEWLIFSGKLSPDISGDKSLEPALAEIK